ncbi:imidazole glycerol phosphate synthase subunit HisF [Legionella antarctica]|uniref:imidazole glycerol-phosphate synthase n=1 Tax=Legionella antarctica TaxID=2708020 RepID=A0A6F8T4J2_9GAMM|nr:imidazole glycerol phosphate synthase cyclase subunit [Legionella antarctica]BCA94942.1 imidazole glycerol phosphate synthase subunit HisF [Legionella antarctica]
MLKKRIIPTLLLSKGRMVKGKQFGNFRDTGDPVSAARIYNAQNADELFFLDIDAHRTGSAFEILEKTIKEVAKECFMPLSVGGGINSVDKIRRLLLAGADKISITTAAHTYPDLINQAANLYGRQCIVVGLDVKLEEGNYVLYSHCGTQKTQRTLRDFILEMTERGAGEFVINSIDNDGMMTGYDFQCAKEVKSYTDRPIIISGGAGTFMHLVDAFNEAQVDAVACASIFHFGDNNPIRARSYLLNQGIPMKLTK